MNSVELFTILQLQYLYIFLGHDIYNFLCLLYKHFISFRSNIYIFLYLSGLLYFKLPVLRTKHQQYIPEFQWNQRAELKSCPRLLHLVSHKDINPQYKAKICFLDLVVCQHRRRANLNSKLVVYAIVSFR